MKAKKILSVILSVILVLGSCITVIADDIVTVVPDTDWYNDTDTQFTLTDAADLYGFAQLVNSGNTFSGKTVKLGESVDLKNQEWTPIGRTDNPFKGTFDGQNNKISNLVITRTLENKAENNCIGLFGKTESPAIIQNVIIENVDITGSLYVGALVGSGYTGKLIENCTVKGKIEIDAWWYAGVIGGNGYVSLVNNCHVNAETGSYIKGNNGSYIGGIWGFRGEGNNKITNCSVANVAISGDTRIGGITGLAHYGNLVEGNSVSNVTVTSNTDTDMIGLIAGANQGGQNNGDVKQASYVINNSVSNTTAENANGEVANLSGVTINGTKPEATVVGTDVTFDENGKVNGGNLELITGNDKVNGGILADGYTVNENGTVSNAQAVAKIGDTEYTDLQTAVNAVESNQTIELLAGVISEGTVLFPSTLTNVTVKGAANKTTVLKDMAIQSADGNSISYEGIVIDGVVFENSNIIMTGWRTGEVSYKDWTITNCEFKDIVDTSNNAAVHFNLDETEAVKNFTFTNNVIDGVSGSSNSGVYMAATGEIIFKDNVINNVAFRPILLQINDTDGGADNITITGNTFSGSAKGRLQIYGTEITLEDGSYEATGTDAINMTVSENIFKDITSTYYICCWGINPTYSTVDLSENYYDVSVEESYKKFFWNNEVPTSVQELAEIGVTSVYTALNEDGTINTDSLIPIAVVPSGTLSAVYTSDSTYWGECGGNASESFEFKLYNDNTYMGYTSLNNVGGIIDGDVYVSWHIKLDTASNTDEYWTMAWEIAPTVAMQPNRVEQWVDGVKVAECAIQPNWADNLFPVVAAVTDSDGKILSYVNNHEDATLENAFANAKESETIYLLKDSTPEFKSQRAITKASVIDLGGHTLTLTEDDLYFGTTTFKNGNIVVDSSVKPSTAVFWMFANQTLTFDNVKIYATGVSGTYLIGLDGDNSDLNLINGSEIIVENDIALDLDIICVNASTGNDIVIDNSKVIIKNLDGRVFFRGNYVVSGNSDIDIDNVKAGFRIEANQTLTIKDNATVNIGTTRDGGIHLTDTSAVYTKAETATVNATVSKPIVEEEKLETKNAFIRNITFVDDNGVTKYQVVLLGGIDSLDYKKVGFEVTVNGMTQEISTNKVYTAINVTDGDGKVTTLNPSDFGDGLVYIFGEAINFTESYKTMSLTYRPFAIDKNGNYIYGSYSTVDMIYNLDVQ